MEKKDTEILLVEDNPVDAELIREILLDEEKSPFNPLRYRVSWVNRFSKALEFIQENQRVDCVLLDLLLPDSSGLETYVNLQSQNPKIPIVILTGLDFSVLGSAVIEKGAADYLEKAIDLEGNLLSHSILFAIERHRSKDQGQQVREERKVLEDSLKKVLKHHPYPIAVVDTEGKVLSSNLPYLSMLGVSPRQVAQKPFPFEIPLDQLRPVEVLPQNRPKSTLWMQGMETVWNGRKAYLVSFFDRRERRLSYEGSD